MERHRSGNAKGLHRHRHLAEVGVDADYRTRFGGTRLRPTVARIVVPTLVLAALAVLWLALVLVSAPR